MNFWFHVNFPECTPHQKERLMKTLASCGGGFGGGSWEGHDTKVLLVENGKPYPLGVLDGIRWDNMSNYHLNCLALRFPSYPK